MFDRNRFRSRALLWIQWVLVSILGWGIGLIPAYIVDTILIKNFGYHFRDFMAFVVIGFSLGVTQWLVLRQYFPRSIQWILATSAGIAVGWNAIFVDAAFEIASMNGLSTRHASNVTFHFILGIISGTILGIAQWIVLRQKFQQAKLWIFANAIGEGLASALYRMWFTGFRGSLEGGLLAHLVIYKGIAMAITGFLLVYLLYSVPLKKKQLDA